MMIKVSLFDKISMFYSLCASW